MSKLQITLRYIEGALRTRNAFGLLILFAFAMPLAFATWQALLNNFVIESAGFTGREIGILQSIREIPGFLAFGVVFVSPFFGEQRLAIFSLILLGVAVAITGYMPSFSGLLLTTMLSSIGFHVYETIVQSLQLQFLPKATAPKQLGILLGVGSFVSFCVYFIFATLWNTLNFQYQYVYLVAGMGTVLIAIYALLRYPVFPVEHLQNKGLVFRKRYWLYYLLQFLSGARRQIFVVFAGFMMVEKYHYSVSTMSLLLLTTFVLNTFLAPLAGEFILRFGERRALIFEYTGLFGVFAGYMGLYIWQLPGEIAAVLFVLDHIFFSLMIAMKTYFQKIADPKDFRSTAAVSFTINHIAAVTLPVLLGFLWLKSPVIVFGFATLLALSSLVCAFFVPLNPRNGHETVLKGRVQIRG